MIPFIACTFFRIIVYKLPAVDSDCPDATFSLPPYEPFVDATATAVVVVHETMPELIMG